MNQVSQRTFPAEGSAGSARAAGSELFGAFDLPALEQLDRVAGHDRGDGVLVDELGMPVTPQQHTKIVKPRHDTLELDAVHQKNRQRHLVFADIVEKRVL